MGLMLAALALAALAYGYYLYRASHIRLTAAKPAAATVNAKAVAATASEKMAEAPAAPVVAVAASESQVSSAAKSADGTGLAGAWNHALETLKTTAAEPAAAPHLQSVEVTGPATQPKTVAASPAAAKPVAPRWRPLTDEQRLARAGEVAMQNMLVQATKYPGAYGFRVEDTFEKATLGKAIPIYTISETDRAKYQAGERIKPLLKSTGQWMFPVLSGDHVCCMVKVKYDGHEYAPAESSKTLGDAWGVIAEKWPETAGFHPQLIVYPGIPGYYFTVPELPVPNVTDTVKMTAFQPDVSPADVILASWR